MLYNYIRSKLDLNLHIVWGLAFLIVLAFNRWHSMNKPVELITNKLISKRIPPFSAGVANLLESMGVLTNFIKIYDDMTSFFCNFFSSFGKEYVLFWWSCQESRVGHPCFRVLAFKTNYEAESTVFTDLLFAKIICGFVRIGTRLTHTYIRLWMVLE